MPDDGPVWLGEAVTQFLTEQNLKGSPLSQQELQKLIRWYGKDKDLSRLAPWEVESFGEGSGADSVAQLAPVKAFLAHAFKQGMTATNLTSHLKVKRTASRTKQVRRAPVAVARLSADGHKKAQEELETLKVQRLQVAEDIKRAMADKDFRENAPLDAAREKQGHLEARIRQLETTLHNAEVMQEGDGPQARSGRSRLGSKVVVDDLEYGEEITYVLVDPSEVDLADGKLSIDSPTGKAFLNRLAGDKIEVEAPKGKVQYQIKHVEG